MLPVPYRHGEFFVFYDTLITRLVGGDVPDAPFVKICIALIARLVGADIIRPRAIHESPLQHRGNVA